jgi:hypothetical protein
MLYLVVSLTADKAGIQLSGAIVICIGLKR